MPRPYQPSKSPLSASSAALPRSPRSPRPQFLPVDPFNQSEAASSVYSGTPLVPEPTRSSRKQAPAKVSQKVKPRADADITEQRLQPQMQQVAPSFKPVSPQVGSSKRATAGQSTSKPQAKLRELKLKPLASNQNVRFVPEAASPLPARPVFPDQQTSYKAFTSQQDSPRTGRAGDAFVSSPYAKTPMSGKTMLSASPYAYSPQQHSPYSANVHEPYGPYGPYGPNGNGPYGPYDPQSAVDPYTQQHPYVQQQAAKGKGKKATVFSAAASPWLAQQDYGRLEDGEGDDEKEPKESKRKRCGVCWVNYRREHGKFTLILLGIAVGAAIIGVSIFLIITKAIFKHGKSAPTTTTSRTASLRENRRVSDLTLTSTSITSLMGNPNLHKVFPAMDYTGMNMQYPGCLSNPPTQDNVTLDIAVLSQLTPAIRLYNNDCGQTEMVMTAISRLNLNNTMKVWLGVHLENNATTNTRQMNEMYSLLETYPSTHFKGIIIGNQILSRRAMSAAALIATISSVRTRLSSMKLSLPVSTSEISSDWTPSLASAVDIVMPNTRPFTAGIAASSAAAWTLSQSQTIDPLTESSLEKKMIIGELGWPSSGGTSGKAISGVDGLNTFLNDWVCEAMHNSTQYFWFEAYDQPWAKRFNSGNDQWEE